MTKDNLKPEIATDANTVLAAVKIGRTEHLIRKGDYILFNESCYQFCAFDRRTLKREGWNSYSNLVIPKTTVSKIPFNKMRKEEYVSSGMNLVRWFF